MPRARSRSAFRAPAPRSLLGYHDFGVNLEASGTGMGDALLAPPADARVVDAGPEDMLEAVVTRHRVEPGDEGDPLASVGMFSLTAREAPRDAEEVIAEAVQAAK